MSEYPKALYRKGDAFEWEGVRLDEVVVCDGAAEIEARKQGWSDAGDAIKAPPARVSVAPKADPFDHDGDGQPGGSKPKAQRKKAA